MVSGYYLFMCGGNDGGDFIFVVYIKNQISTDIDCKNLSNQTFTIMVSYSICWCVCVCLADALHMCVSVCLFVCMQCAHRINLLVGVATETRNGKNIKLSLKLMPGSVCMAVSIVSRSSFTYISLLAFVHSFYVFQTVLMDEKQTWFVRFSLSLCVCVSFSIHLFNSELLATNW